MSVPKFFEEYHNQIKDCLGFADAKADSIKTEHNKMSCRLLSNHYGHAADDSLAVAYKRYVRSSLKEVE